MKVELNEEKLLKAEIESFKNGLRLHFDSIKLFENKSYPSSYYLSALALEEFGKQCLIDKIIFRYNEHKNEFDTKEDFRKWCKQYEKALLSHSTKQGFAIKDDFCFIGKEYYRVQKKFFSEIYGKDGNRGSFDLKKQRSIYVGFSGNSLKGKIQKPIDFVPRNKAKHQITAINDYIINYIILVRCGRWELDNENLSRYFNISLLRKLTRIWKYRHSETKKRLNNYLKSRVKKSIKTTK